MNDAYYSQGKRQRDADKQRKKREKAERKAMRRERGPVEPEVVSAQEVTGALPSVDEAMREIAHRANTKRTAATIPSRLFIGSLSHDTTDASLRSAFESVGTVAEAVVVTDRDSGRSKGFGFVTLADRKQTARVIERMDGTLLDGREIVVRVAEERPRRS